MKRFTEKRDGVNVIPLRYADCGIDMPYWKLAANNDLERFLSGDAADKLAAYEDTGLEPDEIKEKVGFMSPVCIGCDGKTADGKRTEKCTYDEDFRKCLERSVHLSELAHAEKQGRLVVLPCKVGDTLYAPTRNIVSEFRVSQFDFGGYEKPYLWVEWHLTKGITGDFRIDGISASEIGKTVFLTREEAEAVLEAKQNG